MIPIAFFLVCIFTVEIFQYLLLRRIDKKLNKQKGELQEMALDFTDLTTAVNNEQTVDAGVITLLTQLEQEITALAASSESPADQAQLEALASQLATNTTALSAAVAAVPAGDIPTPVVTPTPVATPSVKGKSEFDSSK